MPHTHQQQEGWTEDGNYRAVGLGCMRDPGKTAYMKRHATKFPKWNQGFGVWIDGEYRSFSKSGTNWRNELGEELYSYLMDPYKDLDRVVR